MLKKIWLLLLVAVLMLNLGACNPANAPQTTQPPVALTPTDEPITLIENNSLTVRVLKIDDTAPEGYTVSIMVWNQTDINFNYIFDEFAVNDLLYGENFQFDVAPGKKELKRITLSPQRMSLLGLDTVTKISFRFYAMQPENIFDGALFDEDLCFYPLGENAYKPHRHTLAQTDVPLFDNELCTMVLTEETSAETDLIYTLYVKNKTDKDLVLVVREMILNGQSITYHTESQIPAGLQGFNHVFISLDTLAASNITAIESFSADIMIYDLNNYSAGPLATVPVSVS